MNTENIALYARKAGRGLTALGAEGRTKALKELATELEKNASSILEANVQDLENGKSQGLGPALLDRLALDEKKLKTLIDGARTLSQNDDPIGRTVRKTLLDDGLLLEQVTSPLGVILIIFESRPDVIIQIGSLALRSGNAVILKGGSEARVSLKILGECLKKALAKCNGDPNAVTLVESRDAIAELLKLDHLIDLCIPRGSGELVKHIQSSTRIPVLGHAEGLCHVYLDSQADLEKAIKVVVDSKCDYPAACNAVETILVHREFLDKLSSLGKILQQHGVRLRADEIALPYLNNAILAHDEDWRKEYGDLEVSIKTVNSTHEAIDHIHKYGSGHTESIVTEDQSSAKIFLDTVDSSSVFHNASTRFADGYRYGLGAEVGISTSRIHARGPVGVEGLLTTRWILKGKGQGAGEYRPGKKKFLHQQLV